MFCPNCGTEGKEGGKYCAKCGRQLPEVFSMEEKREYEKEQVTEIKNPEPESELSEAENIEVQNNFLETESIPPQNSIPETGNRRENFFIRKSTIKKILLGVAGFILLIILIVRYFSNRKINEVKDGVLADYNYGVCIGDALHEWFGGTEDWRDLSENGMDYVMVRGITSYTITGEWQEQIFLFRIIDSEHFVFEGAFDSNGDYLYMGSDNVDFSDFGSLLDWGVYKGMLHGAFGNKEVLERLREGD